MRYVGKYAGLPVSIIVDCGAEDNFFAKSVSKRLRLAEVVLDEPFDNEVASGNLLRVLHATHQLRLKIGEWKEHLNFNVADTQGHEVISGIPWLEWHNPRVDWRTRQLWLTIRGEEVELKSTSETPIDGVRGGVRLSAMQVKR